MLKINYFIATTTCFLAGACAGQLFSQPDHYQQAYTPVEQSHYDFSKSTGEEQLFTAIESVRDMLIEQSVRFESAEENINYLMDVNAYYSASCENMEKTSVDIASTADSEKYTESYEDVYAYVEEQFLSGVWSKDNAHYMMREATLLSEAGRADIQFRIIQAINDGSLEIEDPSVPLF